MKSNKLELDMMRRIIDAFRRIPRKVKVLFIVPALLFLLVAGLIGCMRTYKPKMTNDTIKFVENPPVETILPAFEKLSPIVGIPEDVEVDYYVETVEESENTKTVDYREIEKPVVEPIFKQAPVDTNITNILIVGSDSRSEETSGSRSDCMLLLSYNRKTQTASLVSFMRDAWVRIPNHGMNRLNAAFAFGGIGLCINTINENFKLDIQNYVVINFEGLKKIVDDLDGVSVYISKNEADYINASNGEAGSSLLSEDGEQVLNGEQLLAHCRNRKSSSGDFERTRRQRDAMIALFYELKSTSTLTELSDLLRDSVKNVQTNIQLDTLLSLGFEAIRSENLSLTEGRIPYDNTWNYANKDGRSVVEIDLNENVRLLHELLY